MNVYNVGEERF